MAHQRALYLMPSVAVLATAALVLGPGRERPAIGARVWGVPAEGATAFAWRLETMERQFGSDRAVPVDPIEITVSQGSRSIATWKGSSAEDGVAEATFEVREPLSGTIDLLVTSGRSRLAEGPLPLAPSPRVQIDHHLLDGVAAGPVALRVEIARGVLASPFPGVVRILASRDGAPAEGLELSVKAEGADLDSASRKDIRTDQNGEASLILTPTWHSLDLDISARDAKRPDEPQSTWKGGLPVHPGALWLRPGGDVATVLSPVPRDRIYLSALSDKGRVFGASIPVQKDPTGIFTGTFQTADLLSRGALAITLAGDPQELGSGTVTFPFASTQTVLASPRLTLLQDGVPFADRLEKKRASMARLVSVGIAFVAAIFEAVLLILHSRESQARLAAHLARASEDADDRAAAERMTPPAASRAFTLVVFVGIVVLGFAAIAAFTVVR